MARLAQLHSRLQFTTLILLLVLIGWGLLGYLRKQGTHGSFRAWLTVAQLLVISDALLGVPLLFVIERAERFILHIIYGLVAVACLPAAYLYSRRRDGPWERLIYAGVCFFLAGVLIRTWETGR